MLDPSHILTILSRHHWDITLALAVCLQATALAYLHHPKWKAFLLTLPIPFTLATLSVGHPVDATNVSGTIVLLAFTHAVRVFAPRITIVPAILISAAGYCLIGTGLAKILPSSEVTFWLACGAALAIALVTFRMQPPREEPGHRTSLPVWVKAPLILLVITGLVVIKNQLGGFMTMFPMVGVVAAYEGRHCLWTLSRQIPIVIFTAVPMMMTIRLLQGHIGLGGALLVGWVVFMSLLIPLSRDTWRTPTVQSAEAMIHD